MEYVKYGLAIAGISGVYTTCRIGKNGCSVYSPSTDASKRRFSSTHLVLIVFCAIKILSEEEKALLTVFRAVIFRIGRQKGWNPGK